MSLPPALPAGSRLLHIGLPKTGTTALQASFHAARAELARHGVNYVSKGPNPLRVARYAAGSSDPDQAASLERRWQRLASAFRDSDARVTVLSSEGFSGADAERVDVIADALGTDATVVVTLRPVAALLPSQWQQGVRRGFTGSFDEWLPEVLDATSPHAAFISRYSPESLLATWGRRFPEDRLVFVCGDPGDRTFNHRTFEALIGTAGVLTPQPVTNSSPPYLEVELLRHLNLVRDATDGAEADERWTRVMRRAGRSLGDTPPPVASEERLRLPRWAVERTNEQAEVSIAALRASGAMVIGDLAHLRTDPAGHPEQISPPTAVGLEMAGWFADTIARLAVAEFGATAATVPPRPARTRARTAPEPSTRQLLGMLRSRLVARVRRRS